jgi:hypothetical protein
VVRRCLLLSFCGFDALLQVSNSVSEDLILAEVVDSDDVAPSMRPCLAYQKRPLRKIDAIGRNKVRVETGCEKDLSRFPLIKHGGKWLVDETGEFEFERTIITY